MNQEQSLYMLQIYSNDNYLPMHLSMRRNRFERIKLIFYLMLIIILTTFWIFICLFRNHHHKNQHIITFESQLLLRNTYQNEENDENNIMGNEALISFLKTLENNIVFSGYYLAIDKNDKYISNEIKQQLKQDAKIKILYNSQDYFIWKHKSSNNISLKFILYHETMLNDTFVFTASNKDATSKEQINLGEAILSLKGNITSNYKNEEPSEGYLDIYIITQKHFYGTVCSNNNTKLYFETFSHFNQNKIHIYIISSCMVTIISMCFQLWLSFEIEDKEFKAKAFTLFLPTQTMIWTMYNIYSNFMLMSGNGEYFYLFIFLILFFLIHFACDMKIWVTILEYKYQNVLIISSLTFFSLLISFSSFIVGLRLYFNKYYVTFHTFIIWLPQIIYNYKYKNQTLFPFGYVLITSFYRMYTPMIMCFDKVNLFSIKNTLCVFILNICLCFGMICIMYALFYLLNVNKSSNVFDVNDPSYSLYKNKEELRKICPGIINYQCAICLGDFMSVYVNKKDDMEGSYMFKKKKKKYKWIFKIMFEFVTKGDKERKQYMITRCKHIFHSDCLETWMECKNKCPNCRREIFM